MHIFGLILFAGIVSSSTIRQISITQKTVVTVLSTEQWNKYNINLTTILETLTLKNENNYQDCICTPFHKCKTYEAAPDGNEIIDIRINAAPCQSYFDVCCNGTNITSIEKHKPSSPDTTDRCYYVPEDYSKEPNIDHKTANMTKNQTDGHEGDHAKEPYLTHNKQETEEPSDGIKGDNSKDPYVSHNVDDTEKPSDGLKGDQSKDLYVTYNEENIQKPSDGHKGDHTKDPYVTNNEEGTAEKPSDGLKGYHSKDLNATHNEEDIQKPSDSHKGDHTKDPYVTNNEEHTAEKPSDGLKGDHTKDPYVTHNVEDTKKPSDDLKGDQSKDLNATHNEADIQKPSDSHKADHTKDPYVTNNEEDTEAPSVGHKGDHTKDPYVTNNEEDTEASSVSHKVDHTKDPYVTNNEEDTAEKPSDGLKGDHSKDINATHNEADIQKPSDSHKGEHTKDPYVTHNVEDTEMPSDGLKGDNSKDPYVTHNEEETNKTSDGSKGNHTKDPDHSYGVTEKLITHANISTTEPDKSPNYHQKHHECGVWNKYGVGFRIENALDSETQFAEFPSMVAILKEVLTIDGESLYVLICGGSLIKNNVILTSASCVKWENDISTFVIRAGEWDLKTDKETLTHQDRRVKKIVIHPDYIFRLNDYNEVALIFTEYSFSLQDNIQLICLPSKHDIIIKDKCYSSGWGRTVSHNNYTVVKKTESGKKKETGQYQVSILKKDERQIAPRDTCLTALRKKLGPNIFFNDSFICVDGQKRRDLCKGNGGSPLMCPYKDEPDRLVQVGIVTYTVFCSSEAYINVASFMNWITNEIEKYSGY